jgi:MFS transporter, UMF1 family
MVSVVLIHQTPTLARVLEQALGLGWEAQHVFLVVGCAAGMSLGACQSATRTLVGLFAPLARAAELFGFWGLTMKLAGASGLLVVGVLQGLFGLRAAVLFCVVLFFAAWVVAWRVDQERGEAAAEAGAGAEAG